MNDITKEQSFILDSVKILKERTSRYGEVRDFGVDFLKSVLGRKVQGVTISGRIKDADKLPEKIYRKNYVKKYDTPEQFIKNLPDGIGIRIVCLMKNEENRIYEILKEQLLQKVIVEGIEYSGIQDEKFFINLQNQPERQKNNLEIFRMDALYINGNEKIRIEIQIKSLTHYFWGELEHSLFYKNYDYTLSNNFYASLMKNINSSLENLDYEIELLQKHMARTPNNQMTELREIATLMISKKYERQVETILECKIDLREVYAMLTDLHFGLITNAEAGLKLLDSLNSKLNSRRDVQLNYEMIDENVINEQKIGTYYFEQAKILDENIHSGDVFWRFLFLLFKDIYCEDNEGYSGILQKMIEKINRLYDDVMDAADALQESDFNIRESIDKVFNLVTKNTRKIGFYSLDFGMNKIKDAMKKCISSIQCQIVKMDEELSDVETYKNNVLLIEYTTYISVMSSLNMKISVDEWDKIIPILKEATNYYQIAVCKDVIDYVKNTRQLDEENFNIFESVLGEDEEDV